MKAKVISVIIAALAVSITARAQFYSYGNERGSLRWSQIETPSYRVVYPRGLDSLARAYAVSLEKFSGPVSASIGFRPGESFRKKMPVILHPHSTEPNGMVSLIPLRMELQTNPDPYSPELLPWMKDLTIHESRHVCQLQFTRSRGFRFLSVLMGELGAGALAAVYGGPNFDEGDAVLAETALTGAGRGRSSDFLEYMRVSFAAGDWRDYWKWRYGSQKSFTPDHYKVGYITMAGMRTLYDAPQFTKDFYERISRHHGIAVGNLQKTAKEASGLKFKDAFRRIEEKLDSTWAAERRLRAPFIEAEKISSGGRLFTEYRCLEACGGTLLAVRRGIAETPSLVRIFPDGREEKLHGFSSLSSRLRHSGYGSRVYWTEYRRDPRWSMESFSDLKYMDPDGKVRVLVKGKRYFNPAPSGQGRIAAVEYMPDGSEKLVTVDAGSGKATASWKAPDGMQIVEPAWLGDELYVSAVSEEGFGIYRAPDFECVLSPSRAKIKRLDSRDGRLVFASDLNGVDEIYSYNPSTNDLRQLSSTPDGVGDFAFMADTLYFTMLSSEGRDIFKTAVSSLQDNKRDFADIHRYAMADRLSAQETVSITEPFSTEVSGPRDYSKAGHFLKLHSWLPVYFNCDDISGLSFETLYQDAGPGVTAFFQNELSTVSGLAGIHVDAFNGWRPSAHLKLNCSGLYPVFELQADFNDRLAQTTSLTRVPGSVASETSPVSERPGFFGSAKTYIPFNFSSGGWNRGLVPQIRFAASNDILVYSDTQTETKVHACTVSASLRGYTMRSLASSGMFPRLGIGAETGYQGRPGFTDVFCANAYGFLYGYIPGLMDTHGIKLTAAVQGHVSNGMLCEAYLHTVPRGFSSGSAAYMSSYPLQTKFTFDYALPFAPVSWSGMSPVAYVRNFELTLHADWSMFRASSSGVSLFSAGAGLAAHLGNFFWVPYDTRIGIQYDYLGGPGFGGLAEKGCESVPHAVGLLFSVDF